MKYVQIKNGFISDNSILSSIANAITKVAGVSSRHGEFMDEFIHSVSGYDLNKGIKINIVDNRIEEIKVYIDVINGFDIELVIEKLIKQIRSDLDIFLEIDTNEIDIHVLEVK